MSDAFAISKSEWKKKETKKKLKTAEEASTPFYTRGAPNNLQTLQKFKVPDIRDISVILTPPHRHSSFFDILPSSFRKENIVIYYLKTRFIKKHFCSLLTTGFLYSLSC